MSHYGKELRGTLDHGLLGLCVNPSLLPCIFEHVRPYLRAIPELLVHFWA